MHILIISGGGADKMGTSFQSAFESLGHSVSVYFGDSKSWRLYAMKLYARTPLTHKALQAWDEYRDWNSEGYLSVIRERKPDMVLMMNFNSMSPRTIRSVSQELKIPTAYIVMADPLVVDEFNAYYVEQIAACSRSFFINRSAIPSVAMMTDMRCGVLPIAADPNFYKSLNMERDLDCVIVGQFASLSTSTITKAYILDALCAAGIRVAVAGNGVEKLVRHPAFSHLGGATVLSNSTMPIEEVNVIYNRAKIVISPNHPRDKDAPSPRALEATLAGALALADYETDVERTGGGGFVIFRSVDEAVTKAKYYLSHEAERRQLAQKARHAVLSAHTYRHRAEEMIAAVFSEKL